MKHDRASNRTEEPKKKSLVDKATIFSRPAIALKVMNCTYSCLCYDCFIWCARIFFLMCHVAESYRFHPEEKNIIYTSTWSNSSKSVDVNFMNL